MTRAQISLLSDGRRLHFHDGPIDLIVEAFGANAEIQTAYDAAAERFAAILDELCEELPLLRRAVHSDSESPRGAVAKRMFAAVLPFARDTFITPMAAVAGAVAEEILGAMTSAADLARAYVNNGGDIALHLGGGEEFVVGMVERPNRPSVFGTMTLRAGDRVRGIATSGWQGRSFSLGIAEAVTVLAETAAAADAAGTIIGNAVDLPGHTAIARVPASEIAPDSDLGGRLVTQNVGKLREAEIDLALSFGVRAAESLIGRGLIRAAALRLQGKTRIAGSLPRPLSAGASAGSLAHA